MRCLRDTFEADAFTHVPTLTGEVTQSIVPRLPRKEMGRGRGDEETK